MKKVYITGVGLDKPGIVSAMTEVLARHNGNIEDSTMTILGSQFALIMIGQFPENISLDDVRKHYAEVERALGLTIFIKELDEEAGPGHRKVNENPYIISVAGHDRTGITFEVTRILAKFGVNITDLNAHVMDGEGGAVYIMMIECEIPKNIDRELFERELAMMGESLNVEITYHPVEHVAL